MKRKGMAAIGMAAMLMVTACVPVFAADETINAGTAEETKGVDVTYEVPVSYTVTIPASVSASKENTTSVTVSLSDIILEENATVDVSTTAATVELTGGTDSKLTASITAPDNVKLNSTATSCAFTIGALDGTGVKFAGTHTGTITFKFAYTAPAVTPGA